MSYHQSGLGQAQQALVPVAEQVIVPTACPACSYLEGGTCHWCPNGADVPGCDGCVDRKRPPGAWYERSEVFVPMITAVTTAVVSSLVIAYVLRKLGPKK